MKDCILSLFWPRKDIVGFFEKHGCAKAEVGRLPIESENALKRHEYLPYAADLINRVRPFRLGSNPSSLPASWGRTPQGLGHLPR
jgi:hypothetical protein